MFRVPLILTERVWKFQDQTDSRGRILDGRSAVDRYGSLAQMGVRDTQGLGFVLFNHPTELDFDVEKPQH